MNLSTIYRVLRLKNNKPQSASTIAYLAGENPIEGAKEVEKIVKEHPYDFIVMKDPTTQVELIYLKHPTLPR